MTDEIDRLEARLDEKMRQRTPHLYARMLEARRIRNNGNRAESEFVVRVAPPPPDEAIEAMLGALMIESFAAAKSWIVDLGRGESFGFLGFDFRQVRSLRGAWRAHYTAKLKKRTALLRKLKDVFGRNQSQPVGRVVKSRSFGLAQQCAFPGGEQLRSVHIGQAARLATAFGELTGALSRHRGKSQRLIIEHHVQRERVSEVER